MSLDVPSEVAVLLRSAGYICRRDETDAWIYFEDESLLGFVATISTPAELLEKWGGLQNNFLHKYAARLRLLGQKSWNVYAIFLAVAEPTDKQAEALRQISEDLESTRKITRAGIDTLHDLTRAIYPLLPIQTVVSQYRSDPLPELRGRLIGELQEHALDVLLEGGDAAAVVAAVNDVEA